MKNGKLASLSIVIPVFNDEETVAKAIKEALFIACKKAESFELILIDDASTDKSCAIIQLFADRYKNIRLIKHKKNLGFGKTIKELYYRAQNKYVFSLPGDYQIRAGVLKNLISKIDKGDIVIGQRKERKDKILRQKESWVYNFLLRLLFGINLHDVNSSKLFKRQILDKIKLECSSAFVDAELCVKAIREKLTVCETEIEHYKRLNGTGGGGKLRVVLPVVSEMFFFWVKSLF